MLNQLFVDMNAFFASVEQQERPELRGRPVGVVPMLAETTCCIAASYEAKALGVTTGTGVREARARCPGIRLVEARPELYVRYHHLVVAAVESCLHVDQVLSIDEMCGRLMGTERQPDRAAALARAVKLALARSLGPCLRCSIGLAPNTWLAKVAADLQKPDGLVAILPDQIPQALGGLQLTDLPGIAKNMERRLNLHGVHHTHQLCRLPQADLATLWGSAVLGELWWRRLQGLDLPAPPPHRRTLGHSHVLPPAWRTHRGAYAVLVRLIHKAGARLRKLGFWTQLLTVCVKCSDAPPWERRVPLGTCRDTLTMLQGMESAWREGPTGTPFWVGVVLSRLVKRPDALPLYPEHRRRDALADAMDAMNAKHGPHTVYFAGMFGAGRTAPTRISFTQIPDADDF